MKRTHRIITAGILLLLVSSTLFAQWGRGRGDGPPENRHERLAKVLDLTDEQQSQIEKLHLDNQKAMFSLRSELRSLRDELKLMQTSENFDMKKAEAHVKKMEELRTKMQLNRLQTHQKVRGLLNEEQRQRFDAMSLRRGEGRCDRGGPGMMRGKRGGGGPHGFGPGWYRDSD